MYVSLWWIWNGCVWTVAKSERMEVLASSPRSPDRIKNAMAAAVRYKAGRSQNGSSNASVDKEKTEGAEDERVRREARRE